MLLIVILAATFVGLRKSWWDYRITGLCKQDGGSKVFEVVNLGSDLREMLEFKRLNLSETESTPYRVIETKLYLNQSDPTVFRAQYDYIRNADRKLLGRIVDYIRIGSDIPMTVSNTSTFSCSSIKDFPSFSEDDIFVMHRPDRSSELGRR